MNTEAKKEKIDVVEIPYEIKNFETLGDKVGLIPNYTPEKSVIVYELKKSVPQAIHRI